MEKFFTKNKKYLGLILIAVIAFNFLFLPLTVLAQATGAGAGAPAASTGAGTPPKTSILDKAIGFVSGGSLLFISSFISSLLGYLFGAVLYIEALIIDYVISPTNFSLTNADIVKTGWGITRDLANMFFILILLAIAFATVLKIESYGIKQLWWKVLTAAVLINFSLVIAGFVLDFAQILTTFFLNGITGGGIGTITTRLASSMQILNFYNPSAPGSIGQGIAQLSASGVAAVIGIVLTLIGLVVTVFVFGALAVFLIVRILYIWFLLIVAPIVWIFWIVPGLNKHWTKWWDTFIQWTFFAPIYLFMIYLSLSIFEVNGKFKAGNFAENTSGAWNNALKGGLTTATMPSAIFQWLLVIGLMFGSLIVAQKFGVEGATGARKILTGWGTDTKNWAGRYARRKTMSWTQPMTEEEKKAAPPKGIRARIGAAWRKTGAAIGKAAVAVPGARGVYLKQLGAEQEAYATAYDKYKNVDPAVLEQAQRGPLEPKDRLAIQQLLMEKKKSKPNAGQLIPILDQAKRYNKEEDFLKIVADKMGSDLTVANGYDTAQREELIRRAKNHNIEKEFSKLFPDIAARILRKTGETIEYKIKDIVSKIDKITDILEDQLTADVVKAFNSDQLKSIAKSPEIGKRNKVKGFVLQDFKALSNAEMIKVLPILTQRDNRRRETMRNALDNKLKVLSRKMEIVTAPGFEL